MGRIFISYRRKEAADFTGRLFDRLAGYFGNQNVYMDVDDLISGKDYRAQIGAIIEDCDVLLAIIGKQWLTLVDDSGRRRLENADDQLRIELETAFQQKKKVIPILIHDATQPACDGLPESLLPLAALRSVAIRSGPQFDADVKNLVDHLEQACGIRNPDRRFPLELVLIPLGVLLVGIAFMSFSLLPSTERYIDENVRVVFEIESLGNTSGLARTWGTYADYRRQLLEGLLYCALPITFGPVLIVAGKRWCCKTKDARSIRGSGPARIGRRVPKSNAAVSCLAIGFASLGLGLIATIPAILLGSWTLVDKRHRQGWVRGKSLAVIGMLVAASGTFTTFWVHIPYWQFTAWIEPVDQARASWISGDLDASADNYLAASDSHPDYIHAWAAARILRAIVLAKAQHEEQAVSDLTQVIDAGTTCCQSLKVVDQSR